MNIGKLFGGASDYAHLSGLVPTRGRRAEDDKKDDDAQSRRGKAEGDDDDKKDDQPAGRRGRAEDDDNKNDDQPSGKAEGDDDDKGDDEPNDKNSKAEGDDEDDDKDEMSGKSAVAVARGRERARCKAIFSHAAAAANIELAASLAFDTTLTRQEALAVLKGQQGKGGGRDVRSDRERRNPQLGPGGEAPPDGKKALASSWDRALGKAGVQPRK